MTRIRRLCVFCGSSEGADPVHREAAAEIGRLLAARGIGLVYGGGRAGIMGVLADAVLAAGGEAIGVIPRGLVEREVAHTGLTELRVTASMHERKALMAELSDGFVALPGGVGTLEELFEIWTWAQLGIHRKPCGLLDVAGFWQPLVALADHLVATGFLRTAYRQMLLVATDSVGLLEQLAAYRPPAVRQWITPAQT